MASRDVRRRRAERRNIASREGLVSSIPEQYLKLKITRARVQQPRNQNVLADGVKASYDV
jgi:hypothetical protein